MSLHSLPTHTLTQTEVDQIQEILSQPIIKKYFTSLACTTITNICTGQPSDTMDDSTYIRNESILKGQLGLLETLLSIQPLKSKE